jgi:hypothetical protein
MKRAWESPLAIVGSVASIVSLCVIFAADLGSAVGAFLLATVPLPLAALAVTGCALIALRCRSDRRRTLSSFQAPSMVHLKPQLITAHDETSPGRIAAEVLKRPTGGLATWVYVNDMNEGIRKRGNHRYLFAHATHSEPYLNAFALSIGPGGDDMNGPLRWKLWSSNNRDERKTLARADAEPLQTGWHHVAVRWSHAEPKLDFLIDGVVVTSVGDYLGRFPNRLSEHITIGSWPIGTWRVHFAETRFWRTQALWFFPDDAWFDQEMQLEPNSASEAS